MIVDDEEEILAALRRLLRNEPYRLLTTKRPEEAMDWVLAEKAELLIADQRMPGTSGVELLKLTRACCPFTTRVLLSGQADPEENDVVQRMIRKPWEGDELKAAIRDILKC